MTGHRLDLVEDEFLAYITHEETVTAPELEKIGNDVVRSTEGICSGGLYMGNAANASLLGSELMNTKSCLPAAESARQAAIDGRAHLAAYAENDDNAQVRYSNIFGAIAQV
ncbi:hypothetical protein [Thermocrispum municipale]|jgi:hypothetical protein|uniref:hypothetical protein n=1 Tax=Thermocrispum municipale TaxID=37926 RepID=UPI0003FC1044|nr:hypothetical protein [Thermocrispum municipale]